MDDFARFSALDSRGKTAAIANSMNYLTKKGNLLELALMFILYLVFTNKLHLTVLGKEINSFY